MDASDEVGRDGKGMGMNNDRGNGKGGYSEDE